MNKSKKRKRGKERNNGNETILVRRKRRVPSAPDIHPLTDTQGRGHRQDPPKWNGFRPLRAHQMDHAFFFLYCQGTMGRGWSLLLRRAKELGGNRVLFSGRRHISLKLDG